MSASLLIARHEWRRLAAQPFAWILAAMAVALMAWQFLLALEAFLELSPKLVPGSRSSYQFSPTTTKGDAVAFRFSGVSAEVSYPVPAS